MIIDIVNNKGGTGKTTTCVNLAAAMVQQGYRVLLVDLDPQASASLSLGISFDDLSPSIADSLFAASPKSLPIRDTPIAGLDLVTAELDLASADLALADQEDRENRLARLLAPVRAQYDFIFCDCPPSMSMLVVNALVAADGLIIPVTPDYLALEGLVSLTNAVEKAKAGLGISPRLFGIVFTQVNPALNLTKRVTGLVRGHFQDKVFATEVRRDVKLAEAPAESQSVFDYAPASRGAEAYAALAAELLQRIDQDDKDRGDRLYAIGDHRHLN